MKQAIISPVYDLDLSDSLSHTYLILSWLCKKDPQYKSYWNNIKRKYNDAYVILDNGANEGQLSSDRDILSLALEMNVNEIVAPDEYLNADFTIEKTKKFLDDYYEDYIKGRLNIQAVIQGRTKEDFLKCYNYYLNEPRINIIGIGYRNLYEPFIDEMKDWFNRSGDFVTLKNKPIEEKTFYYTISRFYFINQYIETVDILNNDKQIHMLGLTNPYELHIIKQLPKEKFELIRSCDSAAPIQAAQANVLFDKNYGVKSKPKAMLDFEERLSSEQRMLAQQNIQIMKEWINE